MRNPVRLVVLGRERESTRIVVNHLRRERPVHAVVLEDAPLPMSLIRQRVRRWGWARVAGQVAFQAGVLPLIRRSSRERRKRIACEHNLDDTPIDGLPLRRVASVNSTETIACLGRLAPDVVVVSGTSIISTTVLETLDALFLNVHAGITPTYRGVHGGYWALAQRDPDHFGVTVHSIDRGIDTGPVVSQQRIRPTSADSFATYPLLQLAAGLPLLSNAIAAFESQTLAYRWPEGPSRQWSHPTVSEYLRYRARGLR